MLWRCWLGGRKGIWPVKKPSGGCRCGYLSGARCRLAYGPADATATHCLLLQQKSRLVLPLWYRLTWVVPEKGPLNRGVCVQVSMYVSQESSWIFQTKISTVVFFTGQMPPQMPNWQCQVTDNKQHTNVYTLNLRLVWNSKGLTKMRTFRFQQTTYSENWDTKRHVQLQ